MKTKNKQYVKMRNKFTQEIYYTYPEWESKEVDGVEFLPVSKFEPSQKLTQQLYFIKKDSLEKVK